MNSVLVSPINIGSRLFTQGISFSKHVHSLLLSAALIAFSAATTQAAPASTPTFTFNGSTDGLTFSVEATGNVLGTVSGSSHTDAFRERDFGNFIIPERGGATVIGTGSLVHQYSSFSVNDRSRSTDRLQITNGGSVLNFLSFIVPLSKSAPFNYSGTLENISVAAFNLPGVNTFEQLFDTETSIFSGRAGGSYRFQLLFISNYMAPVFEATGSTGERDANSSPPTTLVTDGGSIISASTTGLGSMSNTLGNVQSAAQNATRDLNNRLFRARSGKNGSDPGVASMPDVTSRYLNFAQSQNIDYRVALGLADGKEVELVDTLSAGGGHPLAMVGVPSVSGSAVIAVEGGSGKNSVTDKVVIDDTPHSKFEVFSQFDYGFYDQDNLTQTFRGFETDTYAGSIGGEMRVNDWLLAGVAYTYLNSDTQSTANLGSSDLEGNLLSSYFTAFHGNTHLNFLYSYGDFKNDITRNTLLGRTAYGDTESHSHNFDLNLGHTIEVNERFSFGPSAGLNYTTGEVDGYTERNGGAANLIYPDHDFESMIGRLGGYATFTTNTAAGLLTTQLSAGWAHEFQPENGNVTASLETSPFALVTGNNISRFGDFTASEERAHAGTDWLELGATARLDINNTGFHLELGYQGQFFRNNASGHFGSAKVGYDW